MLRILTITLTFSLLTACNQCNVKEGIYNSIGGSEYSTQLKLATDYTFSIIYETWEPTQYENREKSLLSGTWSCEDSHITLKTDSERFIATHILIGKNPLGLEEDTRALLFEADYNSDSFLYNETLYSE